MRVFQFSLAKILDLRREVEQDRARKVAQARDRWEEARQARENLLEIHRVGREQLADAHRVGGSVGRILTMELVAEHMERQVREAEERCRDAQNDLSFSLSRFAEAFKERKILDRLRSRKMEEWKVEEGRREQKELDEVAVVRHGRPSPSAPEL